MFTLKAKHWQAFLYSMLALVLATVTISDSALITNVCNGIGYLLYFGWFAVLGNELFPLRPADADYSLTWFLLDVTLVVAFVAGVAILTENRNYHAEGLAALPTIYVFFAVFHLPWFLAVSLVAIEKQRKPEFGFYFGTLLLLLWWPIGVWFIQPRLNKIHKTQAHA